MIYYTLQIDRTRVNVAVEHPVIFDNLKFRVSQFSFYVMMLFIDKEHPK